MKKNLIPVISLRATITIDIEAGDFLGAAEHQRRIETFVDTVRDQYPNAVMAIKERRIAQTLPERTVVRQLHPRSGKMSAYE